MRLFLIIIFTVVIAGGLWSTQQDNRLRQRLADDATTIRRLKTELAFECTLADYWRDSASGWEKRYTAVVAECDKLKP